ncbi:MAG: sigma-E factor negative regulatory protein [Granulosicoccus sp.]
MHDSDKLNNKQKLSQLMDGEWHELNPADCVASLCADDALKAQWSRYHMIRDVLKNEPVRADHALASRICDAIRDEPSYSNITPFSGASSSSAAVLAEVAPVRAETEAEAQSSVPVTREPVAEKITSIQKKASVVNTGVAGFALAASVALVTVVGLNLFEKQELVGVSTLASNIDAGSPVQITPDQNAQNDTAVLPVVDFVANTGSYWVSPESSQRVSDEQRLNMMLSQHIENSPTSVREGVLPYSRLVGYEASNQGQ